MIYKRLMQECFENQIQKNIIHFSVSEYLTRIEQEHIKILEAKENEPKYTVTLWIGLNGIRMNEDGSLEWINRKNESVEKRDSVYEHGPISPFNLPRSPAYIPYPGYMSFNPYYQPMQSIYTPPYLSCSIYQSIQEQTQNIDQNIRSLLLSQIQTQQNQNIINSFYQN